MVIVNKNIENYISNLTAHLIPELEDLERETYQKVLLPHMISGKEQGVFLNQFTAALKPRKVLELGTFTGYSAICMALAMSDNSQLTTLDINEEISYLPRKYFELCGVSNKIIYNIIPALDYISTLEKNSIDMIFIDADKKNYPIYFEKLKSKLKPGGYILVDNVLWHGKILDDLNTDSNTTAIRELTSKMFADNDFICSILPLRDGILIGKKKD